MQQAGELLPASLHEDIARKRQPLFLMLVVLASIRLSLCAVLPSERFQASSFKLRVHLHASTPLNRCKRKHSAWEEHSSSSEGSGSAKHADQSADPTPVGHSARTVEATSSAVWFAARTFEPMQSARRTKPHPRFRWSASRDTARLTVPWCGSNPSSSRFL